MSSFVEFYKRTASVLVQDAGSLGSRPGRAAGGHLEAVCGGAVRLAGLSGKSVRAEARRLAQVQTGLTLGPASFAPISAVPPRKAWAPRAHSAGSTLRPCFPDVEGPTQGPQPLMVLGEPRWLRRGGRPGDLGGAGLSLGPCYSRGSLQVQGHKEGRCDREHVLLHLHAVPRRGLRGFPGAQLVQLHAAGPAPHAHGRGGRGGVGEVRPVPGTEARCRCWHHLPAPPRRGRNGRSWGPGGDQARPRRAVRVLLGRWGDIRPAGTHRAL